MGLLARRVPIAAASLAISLTPVPALGQNSSGSHRPVLVRTQPEYPELARRMHVSGDVMLRIEIQPNGTVIVARVESGHALLRQAATDAVLHWRFAPAPESSVQIIAVSFKISEPHDEP